MAADGSLNRLGLPFTMKVPLSGFGPINVALELFSQFVGQ